jgi:ribosomal 50S subunit-recycling heat shock protein
MLKVRVLTVKETVGKAEASELYEVISSESTQIRNESN